MSRALIILDSEFQRRRAADWCWSLKDGTRCEFKAPRRSNDQNSLFWAMLTEVATQTKHHGIKLTPDDWRLLFLDALKREVRMVPNLDGNGIVSLGRSSSDLTKEEFSGLLELINAFAAERGVVFKDQSEATPLSSDEEPEAGGQEAEATTPAAAPASGVQHASEADKRECLDKFLALSTDDLTVQERRDNIESVKEAWKAALPGDFDFVKACMTTADKVAKSEIPMAKARQYLESLI